MTSEDFKPRPIGFDPTPGARPPTPSHHHALRPLTADAPRDLLGYKQSRRVAVARVRPKQCVHAPFLPLFSNAQIWQERDLLTTLGPDIRIRTKGAQFSDFCCRNVHDDCPQGACETNSIPSRTLTRSPGFSSLNEPSGLT